MSEIDFSAWEAPPPPDGLADAVVARMAEPEPQPEPVSTKRRWVIAASAAGVLAVAAGVWAIARPHGTPVPDHGAVLADRAQHIELGGGISADLDRGTDVRWHRTAHGVEIEQRAGAASWRVGGDEHVMIGATVASIDAAGASLRVEVPMNVSDVRVIGASALTAATVAMVTVVVYEGHVKVASSGQTVVVQPGSTYTIKQQPPAPVVTATVEHPRVAVLGLEGWQGDAVAHYLVSDLRALAMDSTAKELADEKLLHDCESEAPVCMAAIGSDLGAAQLIYGSVASQRDGYDVTLKLFDVGRQQLERTVTERIPASESQGPARQDWAARLYAEVTGAARKPPPAPPKKQPPACDADALIQEGNQQMADGKHIAALAKYEAAIACKPEERVERLAFMASCNAVSVTKAREHWGKLSSASQNQVLQICVRNGITLDQLDTSCDADDLQQKGMSSEQVGQHGAALSSFEEAMHCKNANLARLYQLSFMAACNAKSVGKARQYWGKLAPAPAQTLKQMCVRNGITEDMLDGGPAAPAPAAGTATLHIDCVPQAQILIDGAPTGKTTPVNLTLTPGKHKVTYVIGADRFTYPVTLRAGETESVSKDLR